jgi:ribonuclease Z
MLLTCLGTGAGVPMRARNVAGHALRLPDRSDVWLFDCGEGTQHRLMVSDASIGRITRIFITHLHGDHLFGLPGLLATCGMSGNARRIDLHGPAGLERFLMTALEMSGTWIPFELGIHVVESGEVVVDGELTVTAARLDHRIETFGYRVEERERTGTFDAARAAELGVPAGPLYGALKRGERITLPNGRVVDGRELTGAPEPGRAFAYCSDTIYSPAAVELARGADILLHEATFAEAERNVAELSSHSTAAMAARTALEAGAGRLLLTHISSRYGGAGEARLLDEARAIFTATEIAEDLTTYEIERRHRT